MTDKPVGETWAIPEESDLLFVDTALAPHQSNITAHYYAYKPWVNDFSEMRNYCLQKANETKADWLLLLDSDERLDKYDLNELEAVTEEIALVKMDECYLKEKLFKLPTTAKFVGKTHEAPLIDGPKNILKNWAIRELPKSEDQLRVKFARDLELLKSEIQANPNDGRWWLYLGETQKNLGDLKGAVESFANSFNRSSWDEQKAWALYRIAECEAVQGRIKEAIGFCTTALAEHPGFAEAAWLAGWCNYQLGAYQKSLYWSRIAKIIASVEERYPRIGFRNKWAYEEGANEIFQWSLKKLRGE